MDAPASMVSGRSRPGRVVGVANRVRPSSAQMRRRRRWRRAARDLRSTVTRSRVEPCGGAARLLDGRQVVAGCDARAAVDDGGRGVGADRRVADAQRGRVEEPPVGVDQSGRWPVVEVGRAGHVHGRDDRQRLVGGGVSTVEQGSVFATGAEQPDQPRRGGATGVVDATTVAPVRDTGPPHPSAKTSGRGSGCRRSPVWRALRATCRGRRTRLRAGARRRTRVAGPAVEVPAHVADDDVAAV